MKKRKSKNDDRLRGDVLIEKLLRVRNNSKKHGKWSNDLLTECFRGFPLERLRVLIADGRPGPVHAAAFVIDELGSKGRPLLAEAIELLNYPHYLCVRFDAIAAIQTKVTPSDGSAIRAVLFLLDDRDPRVRWRVLRFLSQISGELLSALSGHMEAVEPGCHLTDLVKWLASSDARDYAAVRERVASTNGLAQTIALVAAVRTAIGASLVLGTAAKRADLDDAHFARSALSALASMGRDYKKWTLADLYGPLDKPFLLDNNTQVT